jgi:predicted Zn-dependent protease
MTRRPTRAAALCAALAIAGCGTTPEPPRAVAADRLAAPARGPAAAAVAFEVKTRERAQADARSGRLADAATGWEILTLLEPSNTEYRERLNETRRQIEAAVFERLQRAQQCFRRGDLDAAAVQFLQVLALQPDNPIASDALRAVERERNKRSYLGKPSRVAIARRDAAEAPKTPRAVSAAQASGRNDLEDAAALRAQGELIDAIALLERHLVADHRDNAACQMLAEMYFQQGETQVGRDDANAAIWYRKSLRLDASNAQAAARLRQIGKDGLLASGAPAVPRRGNCASTL